MSYNDKILGAAGNYLGLKEWPGAARHNPEIVDMFAAVGHSWVKDDETPWCAAFVGAVLGELGLPHTAALNARSYEKYGKKVDMRDAQPGDIVVLWRGSRNSWQGHVAFLVRFDGDSLILRGGNQGNSVSDVPYSRDRVVAIRRATGVAPVGAAPTIQEGDKSAFVADAQWQLTKLGYTLGKVDGHFGSRTLGAVVAFQNDNNLKADGIVGQRTWDALQTAKPRAEREVTMKVLEEKSRTVKAADKGKLLVELGGGAIGVTAIVDQINEAMALADEAKGLYEQFAAAGPTVLMIVLIIGVVYGGRYYMNRVKEVRLNDAQTGANDRI